MVNISVSDDEYLVEQNFTIIVNPVNDSPITSNLALVLNEDTNIIIQINGKKRSIINCKKGITEEALIKTIKGDIKVNKFLENKKNIKSIFIKDKLLNLIIKE